jgi:hypothetical protein
MIAPRLALPGALVVLGGIAAVALPASEEQPEAANAESPVAARVNGVPIFAADVRWRVQQSLQGRSTTAQARRLAEAQVLRRLVRRQKVLVQLRQQGDACTPEELNVALQRLQRDLARHEKTLDDYRRSRGIPPASLRQMLEWQLSWQRCTDKYLTDENLQRYFDRHRREFDGTRLRVAQVLWKRTGGKELTELVEKAREVREDILAGKLSFAEAARKYSQSPSGSEGGRLGWISRHEPMPEFFAQAAYQLEVGQIGDPVTSPYGVHLIKVLEVQPGDKTWQQVREQLAGAAEEYLFEWLAGRNASSHQVCYTGLVPHFVPGTQQLAQDDEPKQ